MEILTLATYNVHEWIGNDGRKDPERILQVVRELKADIVALQEVAIPFQKELEFKLSYIGDVTGMQAVPGPTLFKKDADFGNLLLSKRPLAEIRKLDLTVKPQEPRGAIIGSLPINGSAIKVITTHLGLRIQERRSQLMCLIKEIDYGMENTSILLGDLNEWNPWSRNARWLRSFFAETALPCSYPSWRPMFPLDRILIYPKYVSAQVCVHRSELARVASDHLPIVARVRIDS
jgi:endonuclease/exonuclease/phosphatase family metal-dependent hydrolase